MSKSCIKSVVRMTALLAIIGISPTLASEDINAHVPKAQKVGNAKMNFMLWDIYEATLFAPNGQWSFDQPFVLELKYLRHLSGEKIADRSVQEMRGQGFDDEVKLAAWHTQMREIFPDVDEGDVISGVYTADAQTIFYLGNKELGRVQDPEFSRHFFSIWLSPKTSRPELRLSLLGLDNTKGMISDVKDKDTYISGAHDND